MFKWCLVLEKCNSLLLCLLLWCGLTHSAEGVVVVRLLSVDGGWSLSVNGNPFSIRGVGGDDQLELLAKVGGNTIRTWSEEGLQETLDKAHQHGLMVCAGLWLGHQRHGFDYQSEEQVNRQLDKCLAAVKKYKDHPALLMWGVGNEMEGDGTNPAIWYAVDHIARAIKQEDPHHPTMTVIAELGDDGSKLKAIERYCPNVDIVGINSYAGVLNLPERVKATGLTKPYVVSEHGPQGPWEVGKTKWGAAIEASSTEKGELYAAGYRVNAIENRQQCLGTFAFLWGQKQETSATWFGMLLPGGKRLAAVDAMGEQWTGVRQPLSCPAINALTVDRFSDLKPGEMVTAKLKFAVSGDLQAIEWKLRRDSKVIGNGGDAQAGEEEVNGSILGSGGEIKLTVPESGGAYRLFAYVFDKSGGAAVANVPLYVDAPIKPTASAKAKLPFVLYAEPSQQTVYAPSGYMGNVSAIAMEENCPENPHRGQHCLKVQYRSKTDWGGVLWQSPANDWKGEQPGGLDMTGAKSVEFWARGQHGDEVVSFLIGADPQSSMYCDSAKAELPNVRLTQEWKLYRLDLQGKDLQRIKTGFGWSLSSSGKEVTFYVDDIQYVR
jgi:hypothetical protein